MPHKTARPPMSQEPGAGSYTPPARTPLLRQISEALTIAAFTGGLIGGVTGFIGIRITGPSDQLRTMEARALSRDSDQTRVVTLLKDNVRTNSERIAALEQEQQLQRYMLCIITRTVVPEAVPPQCGQTTLPSRR